MLFRTHDPLNHSLSLSVCLIPLSLLDVLAIVFVFAATTLSSTATRSGLG